MSVCGTRVVEPPLPANRGLHRYSRAYIGAHDYHAKRGISTEKAEIIHRYVRDHYNIGPVIIGGQSMGGIAAMNLVASRKIPGVSGIMLFEPAFSLQSMYYSSTDPDSLIPQITSAYGITGASSGAGSYAVQTAGYDPSLLFGYAFLGVPVWLTGSSSDAVVPFATNGQVLMANLTSFAPSITHFATTGDHADPSNFATPSQASVLASLATWLGGISATAPGNLQ
jgi:pimeloyl-ACP methyl ester carboxylesterase